MLVYSQGILSNLFRRKVTLVVSVVAPAPAILGSIALLGLILLNPVNLCPVKDNPGNSSESVTGNRFSLALASSARAASSHIVKILLSSTSCNCLSSSLTSACSMESWGLVGITVSPGSKDQNGVVSHV